MKRFVKEYANYQIKCIANMQTSNKVKDALIKDVKHVLKIYEKGLVTEDEAMKMLFSTK